MALLLRTSLRATRARLTHPSLSSLQQRHATQDYGSKQSGHEQGINERNPKAHLEHPGPEAPANKGAAAAGASDSSSPQPKIQQPKSAAEGEDEDVRKHNEEMKNRAEKTANQLGEKDNKVDKKFWQGDVGDMKNKDG